MAGPFQFPTLLRGGRRALDALGIDILPQEFIPRGALVVDLQPQGGIVPAAGSLLMVDYLVPPNRKGVLRRLAVDAVDPAGTPSITFSVLRSGASVGNYQNTEAPIGTIGVPDLVHVDFDREQRLQVIVFNASAFALEVHVRAVAWFWDIQQEAGR